MAFAIHGVRTVSGNQGDHCLLNSLGPGERGIAPDHLAIPIDKKLGEIPFNGLRSEYALCRRLQVLVDRVRVPAIDINPGEHREGNAILK